MLHLSAPRARNLARWLVALLTLVGGQLTLATAGPPVLPPHSAVAGGIHHAAHPASVTAVNVTGITRLLPATVATASATYRVVFDGNVTGLTTGNFTVLSTTGAFASSVSGSGTTYTVTVNTGGGGNGTLRLDLASSTGMSTTVNNLPYTGEVYTVTRTFTNPTLSFQGTGSSANSNNDVTAFIDDVQVLQASSGALVSGAVNNPSFETHNALGNGNFGYNPTGAGWTFDPSSGIAEYNSAFGPAAPTNGPAVGLVQGPGQFSQAITPGNGTFRVQFLASQRGCCSGSNDQRILVRINGAYLGTFAPLSTTSYTSFSTDAFTVVAPVISSISPSPAGEGVPVTITGSNLNGATSVTLNGAAASIVSNTATTLVVKLPAGTTATATGTSTVTTGNGSTSSTAFTFLPPPGNALAFDGTDDNVSIPNTTALNLTSNFTIEAWIKPVGTGSSTQDVLCKSSNSQNSGYIFPRTDDTWQNLRLWLNRSGGWSQYTVPYGAAYLNQWHHVAASYDGTTVRMYIDGVAVTPTASGTVQTGAVTTNTNPLTIGNQPGYAEFYRGGLDEARIYNTVLTQAQIQADMRSTSAAVPASLVSYYNFDAGTPAGNNASLTTLYDVAATNNGTLNGFNLTNTNSTSNWVESYALVVPVATATSSLTATGFTANWTPTNVGTVDNYLVDVSTSSTFASVVSGSPFSAAGTATSRTISGLMAGTTYYYRVRANKASVTGQGAPSNVISLTTNCAAPVATTQNLTAALTSNGTVTVAATAVNNGSTANCGPAPANTLSLRRIGVAYGLVAEGSNLTLTAPTGAVFVSVDFASYGTPTGTNGNYILGSCNASNSVSVVSSYLIGQNSATIPATNTVFGDPCNLTPKSLAVRATYAFPASSQVTFSCAEIGANTVQLTVTDANSNVASQSATVTVVDTQAPTAGPLLPAAPTLATSNVPEASSYGVLYQLDIPNTGNFSSLSAVPYTVNNSAVSMTNPARVAYFMELQSGGVTKWVWASMDNFAANLSQLGIPHASAGNMTWHQNVSNLNVYSSTGAGVTTGSNVGTGRIEMWPWNYAAANSDNVPGASGSTFDFGDQSSGNANYGSFQAHNVTAAQTVFAYNNWGGSGTGDLGIGSQVGGSGNPDWTFANNASSYTVKRLYILVPNGGVFTQNASVALNSAGTATVTSGLVYTGATDNCGIASVVVSPSTFSCANVGPNTVTVTVTDNNGNSAVQAATVTVTVPPTPTTTWTGAASILPSDCANWSYGKVPDASTNVVIPAGLSTYPTLSSGTLAAKDLTIASGATLTLSSGGTLQVGGNWQNNGTASLAGNVTFTGSSNQTIGGSSTSSFTTLVVNKPGGTLTMQANATVTGTLTMTSGVLTTGSNTLTTTGATLTESETSYVLGNVRSVQNLSTAGTYSFGNLGLTLTPSGSTLPGSTQVTRVTGTALSGQGTSQSIKRYYDIVPTVNAGLNVTVQLGYLDTELNGIAETSLGIFRSTTGTSGPWQPVAFASQNTTANTITATGVNHFSIWTLGNRANPLPVELTAFTAQAEGADALLRWTTAQEKNNDRFEVEVSPDGQQFRRVGTVAGQGTSTSRHDYQLLDARVARYGADLLYYRLRQVDQDGTSTLSEVRTVKVSGAKQLTLSPNPARSTTLLQGAAAAAPVQVYDAVGRLVLETRADATGQATLSLPAQLPKGVYLVRTGQHALRLVVE